MEVAINPCNEGRFSYVAEQLMRKGDIKADQHTSHMSQLVN